MRIDFRGRIVDEPEIRAGFIGCGSHSFRNLYPAFQFAPVRLVATCDLNLDKAGAFAAKFGAERAYDNHRRMLDEERDLDAIFICTGYDERGRPRYPELAIECLEAGRHVWMEKPPAATCADIERVQDAARRRRRTVLVGFKKMFAPANEKAKELMSAPDFGKVSLLTLQYPQYVPTVDEFDAYLARGQSNRVVGFLDHVCHPASLLIFLLGMPKTLHYERSSSGSAAVVFSFESGAVASLALWNTGSRNAGMERTVIVSDQPRHIVVDNNIRVTLHRNPPMPEGVGYGNAPDFFTGGPADTTAHWEPEFSLGQLYNRGIFLLGYYGEVNEFARAILEKRQPAKGTIEQAWEVTRIFEALAQGPGKTVPL